jgi:hypothetical protein
MKTLFTAMLMLVLLWGCEKSNPADSAQAKAEPKFHDIGGEWSGPTTLPNGQQVVVEMSILHNNSASLIASGSCYADGLVSGYLTTTGTIGYENVVGGTQPDAVSQVSMNINLTLYPTGSRTASTTYALVASGSLMNDSTIVFTTTCSYPKASGSLTMHQRRTQ